MIALASGAQFHRLKPEACCDSCNSPDVELDSYDYGRDPRSGYHDTGEFMVCRECGHKEML